MTFPSKPVKQKRTRLADAEAGSSNTAVKQKRGKQSKAVVPTDSNDTAPPVIIVKRGKGKATTAIANSDDKKSKAVVPTDSNETAPPIIIVKNGKSKATTIPNSDDIAPVKPAKKTAAPVDDTNSDLEPGIATALAQLGAEDDDHMKVDARHDDVSPPVAPPVIQKNPDDMDVDSSTRPTSFPVTALLDPTITPLTKSHSPPSPTPSGSTTNFNPSSVGGDTLLNEDDTVQSGSVLSSLESDQEVGTSAKKPSVDEIVDDGNNFDMEVNITERLRLMRPIGKNKKPAKAATGSGNGNKRTSNPSRVIAQRKPW